MKNKTIIAIALIIIAILFWLLYKIDENFQIEKKNNQEITKKRDELGRLVVTQNQQILDYKDAIAQLKPNGVDKPNQQTSMGVRTIIKEVKVPVYVDKIVYVDSSKNDTSIYVKVPIPLNYNDTWTLFRGKVDDKHFTIDSLIMKNNFTLTIGEQKNGWFKPRTPVIEIISDNPHTDVTSVKNVTIKQTTPFYKSFWLGVIIGAIGLIILR